MSENQNDSRPESRKSNQRGAALMLALFATTLLMVIATEVMFESSVEYVVSTQSVNRVRAYWAARAGVEMSLLRIHIYKQAVQMAGSALPNSRILDEIWRQPFMWPPPIPGSLTEAQKDSIKAAVKASDFSGLKTSYFTTIEAEGAKVDVNDLGSPSKIMADAAKNQILQLFASRIENDEGFSERYRGYDFTNLVNNIADWIDPDSQSRNGGDESSGYQDRPSTGFIPANQPFKTLSELHLVAGMTDELYEVLAPALTLYGGKGINVNQATKEVFYAFGRQFTPEKVQKIMEDRQDPKREPFKTEEDFLNYLRTIGISGNPFGEGEAAKVPLVFEPEVNFRIRSTGKAGQAQSDIIAVVYDPDKIRERLEKALVDQATKGQGANQQAGQNQQQPNPSPGATATPAPASGGAKTASTPAPLRRPKIVYWNEE